jgi:hypothetical protein
MDRASEPSRIPPPTAPPGAPAPTKRAPARLFLDDDELVLEVLGRFGRVVAMKRSVRVPFATVSEVLVDPTPRTTISVKWLDRQAARGRPLKGSGTGVFRYGAYHGYAGWSFWATRSGAGSVVVRCSGARYRYLVAEVDDAAETVAQLRRALLRRDRQRARAEDRTREHESDRAARPGAAGGGAPDPA